MPSNGKIFHATLSEAHVFASGFVPPAAKREISSAPLVRLACTINAGIISILNHHTVDSLIGGIDDTTSNDVYAETGSILSRLGTSVSGLRSALSYPSTMFATDLDLCRRIRSDLWMAVGLLDHIQTNATDPRDSILSLADVLDVLASAQSHIVRMLHASRPTGEHADTYYTSRDDTDAAIVRYLGSIARTFSTTLAHTRAA